MCRRNRVDLAATNASTKAKGLGGSLLKERGSLYWRIRITAAFGESKTRKFHLRFNAQEEVLGLAKTRIDELSGLLAALCFGRCCRPQAFLNPFLERRMDERHDRCIASWMASMASFTL